MPEEAANNIEEQINNANDRAAKKQSRRIRRKENEEKSDHDSWYNISI